MSDLAEVYKKCLPYYFADSHEDIKENKDKCNILRDWMVKDKQVDLHKLCMLIEYADQKSLGDLDEILYQSSILEPKQDVKLSIAFRAFDNELANFYKGSLGKFGKLGNLGRIRYSDLIDQYGLHLGFENISYNNIGNMLKKCESLQQLNFIVNIATIPRWGKIDCFADLDYIKMFILAKKMGYNRQLLLEKFNLTGDQLDNISTQEYYDFLEYSKIYVYNRYLLYKPEKEFVTAAICFAEAIKTNMEDLKKSHVTIPAVLVERLLEMVPNNSD